MRIYLDLPEPPASGGQWLLLDRSAHIALDVTEDYVSLICDPEALEQLGRQMLYLARCHRGSEGHTHVSDFVSKLPCEGVHSGDREFILEWTAPPEK